jgi:TonB-dependent receptor
VRVIAGERLEVTRQSIDPFDQFGLEANPQGGKIHSTDLLPSHPAVVDVTKKSKARASITRTLARPQLRELAPFAYVEQFGGRLTSGNPDLVMTHITNADLRFEYFPTLREVLAASVFFKDFQDPIEAVARASGDKRTITFQNAEGATLFGVELEARKNLGFISRQMNEFTGIANLTLATSTIELSGDARTYLTSAERPMINQAPYVLNLSLDYAHEKTGTSARVLYNITGARIVQVGSLGVPDAYAQPRHLVDFMVGQEFGKHVQLRLTAANVLNTAWVITQGKEKQDDNIVSSYTTGALYTLSATYSH